MDFQEFADRNKLKGKERFAASLAWAGQQQFIDAITRERDALRAALEAVEWVELNGQDSCPWCGGYLRNNVTPFHYPECKRQAALQLGGK
jgi:hypothetical protein